MKEIDNIQKELNRLQSEIAETRKHLNSLSAQIRNQRDKINKYTKKKMNIKQMQDAILVAEDVCSIFRITYDQLRSSKREKELVIARTVVTEICTSKGYKPSMIANVLNVDRTTVYNMIDNLDEKVVGFPQLQIKVQEVREYFGMIAKAA